MFHKTKRKMWMSDSKRLLLAACLLLFASKSLFAEYFVIRDYLVRVDFLPDGALQFEETINVEFTAERHGIFRKIPLANTVNGKYQELIVKNIQVENWSFSQERQGNELILKIGDPDIYVNGKQTYVIRYRVENGLNFFDDHAEFYWDVLGTSWPVLTEKFRFELHLPATLQLTDNDVRLYTGPPGSLGQDGTFRWERTGTDLVLLGETTRLFEPGEAVTVAINLPKDAFPKPDTLDVWYQLHGILLWPAGLLSAIIGLLFYSRNKRQAIMTEYQPPLDISPVIAGGFIDHSVDNNDVLALIPLLASRGYLKMDVEEKTALWVFKSQDVRFTQLKTGDSDLQPFERHFLEALFRTGNTVELDDLKDKFYVHLNSIRSEAKSWIKAQKWYEPDQRFNRFFAYGAAVLCGFFGLGAMNRNVIDGAICLGAAGLIFFFSRWFNQRNIAGNEIYKKLEGFRRFLVKAEKPILERLLKDDPQYFDKTLPYAVAFGEVKHWTGMFDGLLSEPPNWYRSHGQSIGPSRFSMDSFGSQFSSEMNTIGSVFSSSPSSSSSGGGGSSGGGSGGGGGGSW